MLNIHYNQITEIKMLVNLQELCIWCNLTIGYKKSNIPKSLIYLNFGTIPIYFSKNKIKDFKAKLAINLNGGFVDHYTIICCFIIKIDFNCYFLLKHLKWINILIIRMRMLK